MRGFEVAASWAVALPPPLRTCTYGVSEVTRCWHQLSLRAGASSMNPSATLYRRQVSAAAPREGAERPFPQPNQTRDLAGTQRRGASTRALLVNVGRGIALPRLFNSSLASARTSYFTLTVLKVNLSRVCIYVSVEGDVMLFVCLVYLLVTLH